MRFFLKSRRKHVRKRQRKQTFKALQENSLTKTNVSRPPKVMTVTISGFNLFILWTEIWQIINSVLHMPPC